MYSKFRFANNKGAAAVPESSYFIITINTTVNGESFSVPLVGGYIYDFDYRINGGSWVNNTSDSLSIVIPTSGSNQIEFNPKGNGIQAWSFNNSGDRLKLASVDQWGTNGWLYLNSAFYGCSNMVISATDAPKLTSVSSLNSFFRACSSLGNNDLSSWNVSNINDMNSLFLGASFNGDVSSWDVSSVTNIGSMFQSSSFNSDISSWNVSSVTNMGRMFQSSSFDGDISSWNISNVININNLFLGGSLSTANYDLILDSSSGWPSRSVQPGLPINFGSTQYTIAISQTGRDILTNAPNNWTITDGGGI